MQLTALSTVQLSVLVPRGETMLGLAIRLTTGPSETTTVTLSSTIWLKVSVQLSV